MSTKNKVLILLFLIFLVFIVLAKVDYSIEGYGGYYPPQNVVQYHWFWQWTVGIPLMALAFTAAFWAGAPKTPRNRNIAVGIFLTTVFLIVGQLEDFLYFTVNSLPFPTGDWTWIWLYNVFGTWTTVMHFEWLAFWILLTCGMWTLILKK
jgi:uncharacterized BrkB/YihY/UPF0761 family membrane protein